MLPRSVTSFTSLGAAAAAPTMTRVPRNRRPHLLKFLLDAAIFQDGRKAGNNDDTHLQTIQAALPITVERDPETDHVTRLNIEPTGDHMVLAQYFTRNVWTAIMSLSHLQHLHITGLVCYDTFFDRHARFPNLQHLTFSRIDITSRFTLPTTTPIQTLAIVDSNFRDIPSDVFDMISLRSLDLHNCKIESIPRQISALHNLQDLNLFGNKINMSAFRRLRSLQQLRRLNVQYNYFDGDRCFFPNMRHIDLRIPGCHFVTRDECTELKARHDELNQTRYNSDEDEFEREERYMIAYGVSDRSPLLDDW